MSFLQSVAKFFDQVGYSKANLQARRAMWGVILAKLGIGVIGVWSVVNIYYFSFFRLTLRLFNMSLKFDLIIWFGKSNNNLKMRDLTLLVTIAGTPGCILSVFSMKIANHFGFERVIKLALVIGSLTSLVGSFQDRFYVFAFLCGVNASLLLGVATMPLLYLLWSHFPKKTGGIIGVALTAFGISALASCILATFVVNPDNRVASIPYAEGVQEYQIFEESIAKRVPRMMMYLAIFQVVTCVSSIFFINLNQQEQDQEQIELIPMSSQYNRPGESNYQENSSALQNQLQPQNSQNQEPIIQQQPIQQLEQIAQQKQLTLINCIRSEPFYILYAITFLANCLWVFVHMNYKTYGLTKINDDHFLTFILTSCKLLESLSNLLWGYLVDRFRLVRVLKIMLLLFCIMAFIFPLLNSTKLGFFLTFQLLGISHKGLITVVTPGLVQIFGLKMGGQLLPIKGTSAFISLAILPLFQIVLLQYFNQDQCIQILFIAALGAFFLSLKLKDSYEFTPKIILSQIINP